MTTILEPKPRNSTEIVPPKSVGGSIIFLDVTTPKRIRFIDTFELNISMFVILGHYEFQQYVGTTIFAIEVTFDDHTIETIWEYQVRERTVGFSLAQSFFDLQTYRSILKIELIAKNEITLNKHDFIIWGGYMKVIEEVTDSFIGGDIHVSELKPISLKLSWGKTNYDYAIVNWGDGISTGIVAEIYIRIITITPMDPNTIRIDWVNGNNNSVNIKYKDNYLIKRATTNTYTITGLNINTPYTYLAIPYSVIGVTGKPYTLSTITLPTLGVGSYSNISPSITTLKWEGGNYAYLRAFESKYQEITISSNQNYFYNLTGLTTNTEYNFSLTAYNSSNLSSSSIYDPTDIISFVTFATVGAMSVTNITDTTVRVSWIRGSYTTVRLYSSDNSINIPGITDTYIDLTNLYPNKYYKLFLVPVNSNGDEYINGIQTINFVTLGIISNLFSNSVLSRSTYLNWYPPTDNSYTNSFSNINIVWNTNKIYDIPDTQYLITGLTPNTIYTFYAYPNNLSNIENPNGFTTTTLNTLATIQSYTNPLTTINSIDLSWNTNATYSVIKYNNFATPNIYAQSYTIQNIIPNTNYLISIIPYNQYDIYNLNASESVNTQIMTLANIDTIWSCNVTPRSADVYWSGRYTTTLISNPSFTDIITPLRYYTLCNLVPNTYYTFKFTPINTNNVRNTQNIYTTSFTSLASVASMSISNYTITDATISWINGFYENMRVIWTSSGSFVASNITNKSTGTKYNIPFLNINTQYTFSIIPINTANIDNNNNILSQSTVTLASLDSVTVPSNTTTISSITLQWNGTMTSVKIDCFKSADLNALVLTTTILSPSYTTSYTFTNLLPNTSYIFFLTPINSAGVLNPSHKKQITNVTLAYMSSVTPVPLSESAIQLYINIGNATSYKLLQYDPTTAQTSILGNYLTASVYNITSGLLPNITYTYTLIPINSVNVENNTNTLVTSKATLGTVGGSISVANYTTTTATITWNASVTYSKLDLSWSGSSSGSILNITNNTVTVSGLVSNGVYTFRLLPYNVESISNPPVTQSVGLNTLATIGSITVPIIKSTVLGFSVAAGTYTKYSIQWTGPTSGSVYNLTANTYQITNLATNSLYSFTFTAYNLNGVANTLNQVFLSNYTLAIITNISVTAVTSKTFTVNWISDAKYIDFYTLRTDTNVLMGQSTATNVSSLLINYNTFTPNTNYTIYATPYNSASSNIGNFTRSDNGTINTSTVTLATINYGTACNVTITTADVFFSGIFTSVKVLVNNNNTIVNTYTNISTSPLSITDLISNYKYTFTIIPINSVGIENNVIADNGYYTTNEINTFATIGILNMSQVTGSNIVLYWTSGSYTSLNLYANSQFVANISQQSYNFTGLIPNTQYSLDVYALNQYGLSNITNINSARNYTTYSAATISELTPSVITSNIANISLGQSSDYWNKYKYVNLNIYNLLATPILVAPTFTLLNTYYNSAVFNSPIVTNSAVCGTLTWSINSVNTYTTGLSFSGGTPSSTISINSGNGVITVPQGCIFNGTVYVWATNPLGNVSSVSYTVTSINVAYITPTLIAPVLQTSNTYYTNASFAAPTVTNSLYTGSLAWSINFRNTYTTQSNVIGGTPSCNITINSNTGIITVPQSCILNSNVYVWATNPFGGVNNAGVVNYNVSTLSFAVPIISLNQNYRIVQNTYYSSATYDVLSVTNSSLTGSIKWSMNGINVYTTNTSITAGTPPSTISIDQNTGIITVPQYCTILLKALYIWATNPVGGSINAGRVDFTIKTGSYAIPTITAPSLTIQNTYYSAATYTAPTVTNSSVAGTVTWSMSNVAVYTTGVSFIDGTPSSTITIDSSTGIISVPQGCIFSGSVYVWATNPNSGATNAGSVNYTVTSVYLAAPSLIAPVLNTQNTYYNAATYGAPTVSNSSSAGTVTWSINSVNTYTTGVSFSGGTPASIISINSATGVITIPQGCVFNSRIYIWATNAVGGVANAGSVNYIVRSLSLAIPSLIAPVTNTQNTYYNAATYVAPTVSNSSAAGTVTWSINSVNTYTTSLSFNGGTPTSTISINSSTGVITVPQGCVFSGSVYVWATNAVGGVANAGSVNYIITSVSLATPNLVAPVLNPQNIYYNAAIFAAPTITNSSDTGTVSWSINTANTYTTAISFSGGTPASNITINSASGVITVPQGCVFDSRVYVWATNALGGATNAGSTNYIVTSVSYTLADLVAPVINPQNVTTNSATFPAVTVTNSLYTGTLTWSINLLNTYTTQLNVIGGTPSCNITINSVSGNITVPQGCIISSNVYVWATNPLGGATNASSVAYYISTIQTNDLYSFSSFTFTNLNKTGASGPTSLGPYGYTYPGYNTPSTLQLIDGIQYWTVPASGTYNFVIAGAGSFNNTSQNAITIGYGIVMNASYSLTKGTLIALLVGQQGLDNGSAGGGTFVATVNTIGILSNAVPLFVAGGAGGPGGEADIGANDNVNGTLSTTGQDGQVGAPYSAGSGGIGPNGGNIPLDPVYSFTDSGAGFSGDGNYATDNDPGSVPKAFINGGIGGFNGGEGGFGGGGGSGFYNYTGGGGGGYGGGGASGSDNAGAGGGGGGSFDITGIYSGSATNAGNGYVEITLSINDTPVLTAPTLTTQNTGNSSATYSAPTVTNSGLTGTLTWSINSVNTYTTDVSFSGGTPSSTISINSGTGVITVPQGCTFNGTVYVWATNPLGGFTNAGSVSYNVTSVSYATPVLTAPTLTSQSTGNSSATYSAPTVTNSGLTGTLTWSINSVNTYTTGLSFSGGTPSSTISINSGNGVITVPQGCTFNGTVYVWATNPLGGSTNAGSVSYNVTSALYATPVLTAPTLTSQSTGNSSATYSAPTVINSGLTGTLTWSINSVNTYTTDVSFSGGTPSSTISINSGTGVITVPQGCTFDGTVYVWATNPLGGSANAGTVSYTVTSSVWAINAQYTLTNGNVTGPYPMTTLPSYNAPFYPTNITMPTNGYQYISLIPTGTYTIKVAGAAGSSTPYNASGKGAIISGNISLTVNDILIVVCGNVGTWGGGFGGGGGGGQSAVFKLLNGTGIPIPLIVAGGGGGGGGSGTSTVGRNVSSVLYNESTSSTLVGNNGSAGSATQISMATTYANTSYSYGLINSTGTILSGVGSITTLGTTGGGFGGAGCGSTGGSGGAGGGWIGGGNTASIYSNADYGRNMIISTAANRTYIGLNSGAGYVTITRLS